MITVGCVTPERLSCARHACERDAPQRPKPVKTVAEPEFANANALDDIQWMKEQQGYSTPCVGAAAVGPRQPMPCARAHGVTRIADRMWAGVAPQILPPRR